ncbi:MAG TPA: Rv3235 family protein [Mycobacteriales bacterium]|nr:Rv3235 family protein [Mycobacteriales bacterium]
MTAHARAHAHPPPQRPRLRPVPTTEPPYDDDLPAPHLVLVPALTEPLPFEQPAPRRFDEPVDFFDAQPTPRGELPDPQAWLTRLLRVVLECLEGWRAPAQLRAYATAEVVAEVAARRKRTARPGSAPRVRSLHVTEPADGVVEACAVVQRGADQSRAIALRLEGLDGRWRCVALDLVE